jgi:hypothetical protein
MVGSFRAALVVGYGMSSLRDFRQQTVRLELAHKPTASRLKFAHHPPAIRLSTEHFTPATRPVFAYHLPDSRLPLATPTD